MKNDRIASAPSKAQTVVSYAIASAVAIVTLFLVSPVIFAHASTLFVRAFALTTVVFFGYVGYRSSIFWMVLIERMSEKKT